MARIKYKDTKPEMLVRKLVYSMGNRYLLHTKDLPGKPDLVLSAKERKLFLAPAGGLQARPHPQIKPGLLDSKA